jgi:hypothetical protein
LYELTGLSDIMRGSTHPRETLGAQEMKAQYSSARLQNYKLKVATFVGEILKIKASIISQHFSPQTIIRRSNIMLTPDAEHAMEAVQLLKDQWAVCYRLKIDADQMAIPDYNAERSGRVEFITATGQFMSQMMPLIEKEPAAGPFILEILKWGVAGFHSGATIEGVFDKAAKEIAKKLQQPPPPPPPDPAMLKAQTDVKATQLKTEAQIKGDEAKTAASVLSDKVKTQAQIEQDWAKTNATIEQMRARTASEARARDVRARQKDDD